MYINQFKKYLRTVISVGYRLSFTSILSFYSSISKSVVSSINLGIA